MYKKTTIYVCHGWAYKTDNWQPTIDLLNQANIKLKLFKSPGLTAKSNRVFTIEAYVDWLETQLKNIKDPIVLGHSNGGRIALNYCLKHPTKIKHLILVSSAGVRPAFNRRLKVLIFKILAKLIKPFLKLNFFKKICLKVPKIRTYLKQSDYQTAPRNMKQTLANLLASDKNLTNKLNHIKTPISLIWGDLDKVTPLRDGHILNQKLKNVIHFKILSKVQHIPYSSHPQELSKEIISIIKELS